MRLLVVSSLGNPIKRVDWAVQAVAAAGLDDRVVLTFVGDSESPEVLELKRQARELGIREPSFIPLITDRWLNDVMREHDVLVHPAEKEVYGSVISEAMSSGLAVVCSDRCGAAVSIEDGTSGLLFRSDSFEEFTDALTRSVQDSTLRHRMAAAATAFAEANLTPRIWAERFEELLDIKHERTSESQR